MLFVAVALVTVCLALPEHKTQKHGRPHGKRSAENDDGNNGSNDNGTNRSTGNGNNDLKDNGNNRSNGNGGSGSNMNSNNGFNGNGGNSSKGNGNNGSNGNSSKNSNGNGNNSSNGIRNNSSNGNGNDEFNDNGNDGFRDNGNISSEDYDEDFEGIGDSNGGSDAKVLMAVVDIPEATEVLNGILECLEAMDTPVMVLEPLGNMTMSMTRDARRLERKRGRW